MGSCLAHTAGFQSATTTTNINLIPIALSTVAESVISFTAYGKLALPRPRDRLHSAQTIPFLLASPSSLLKGVLFPNLRRTALAAEGKPNLTATSNVVTGPNALTHEQTTAEKVMTKYAPSMGMTFLKVGFERLTPFLVH